MALNYNLDPKSQIAAQSEVRSMKDRVHTKTFLQDVRQSFLSALGSIVFGMEDGTVSIFGLVFGVAASATNSQTVLLAGDRRNLSSRLDDGGDLS